MAEDGSVASASVGGDGSVASGSAGGGDASVGGASGGGGVKSLLDMPGQPASSQGASLNFGFADAADSGLAAPMSSEHQGRVADLRSMKLESTVFSEIDRVISPPGAPPGAEAPPQAAAQAAAAAVAAVPEVKCPQCGAASPVGANFCAACGQNLKEDASPKAGRSGGKKKDGKGGKKGRKKEKEVDEFPNKAYNGELPDPPPPSLRRAGEYEGDLDDGIRQGHGVCKYPTGDVYEGEFHKGMRHGTGAYTYKLAPGQARPRVYEGSWRRSRREGSGLETWPNGSVYEGEYKDDKFNGLGTHRTPFAKYTGQFVDGLKEGKGKVEYYKTRDTYDGAWSKNRFHGIGTYFWASNTKYEGQWHNGLRSGFGVMIEPTGEKYEGHWQSGDRHGAGTVRARTGKCRDGVWKHGRFVLWCGAEYFGTTSSAMHAVGNRYGAERIKGKDEEKDYLAPPKHRK